MIKRKIFLPFYLAFLSGIYGVISFAASFTRNKGWLHRSKMLMGVAIVSLSSTLSGCLWKPKPTCYEVVPVKDTTTENVTCYKSTITPDTSKKGETLQNTGQKNNTDTTKRNCIKNDSTPPPIKTCYKAVLKKSE